MSDNKAIVRARVRPLAPGPLRPDEWTAEDLVREFLSRKSRHTAKAYSQDLRDFAEWMHVGSPAEAAGHLVTLGPGKANALVYSYMSTLKRIGKSPATINRRLACLRSCLKLARMVGLCNFTLDVPRERSEPYTDTRGPALQTVRALLSDLQAKADAGDVKGIRDLAMTRLLWNLGLRGHEVVELDVKHYDRDGGRLSILGKQRSRREWVSLTPKSTATLEAWLQVRGDRPGPLFVSVLKTTLMGEAKIHKYYGRLCRENVYRMLKAHGVKTHGLRHAAITAALDATGGNVRAVQRFSRHRSLDVLIHYDDNRKDLGGQVAKQLDELA